MRFAYRLAFHLGILDPVGEILTVLDRRQLAVWMAYFQLEPPAADRDDQRAAIHTAFLGDRLSLADEPTDPGDLIIDWIARSEPEPERESTEAERVSEADAIRLQIQTLFRH